MKISHETYSHREEPRRNLSNYQRTNVTAVGTRCTEEKLQAFRDYNQQREEIISKETDTLKRDQRLLNLVTSYNKKIANIHDKYRDIVNQSKMFPFNKQ